MYINHPTWILMKTPNKEEALKHCKLVELFDYISNFQFRYLVDWETYKKEYEWKPSIKASYDKYRWLNKKYNLILVEINETIINLNLDHNFESLYDDFHGKRVIVRSIFKKIFFDYGIEFNDSDLKIIFGKFKYDNGKSADAIRIITHKTFFEKCFEDQFVISQTAGYAKGVFSAFFMRAAGLMNDDNNFFNYYDSQPTLHDPF